MNKGKKKKINYIIFYEGLGSEQKTKSRIADQKN